MGLSCGTVFVRDSDLATVLSSCADLAREGVLRFLVAPPDREWIAIYPSEAGQDPAASAALASRLNGRVLHLLLHDSDVVYYLYYRGGVLTDTFCSLPDYFSEVSAEEANAQHGRAELLADVLPPGTSAAELERRLAEIRDTASDRAEAFRGHVDFERLGQALGVPLAMRSYEDLQDGPARGRLGMQHLPDPAAERAAKRRERSRIKTDQAALQKRGVLLLGLCKKSSRKGDDFHPSAVFTFDPTGGLLLFWRDYALRGAEPLPLLRLEAPWQDPPQPTGIALGLNLSSMAVSSSGENLAVGYSGGRGGIELWSLAARTLLWKQTVERGGRVVAFSPDGTRLAVESGQRLLLVDSATGETSHSFAVEGNERFALFHPSGSHLVYAHSPDLRIFDLRADLEVAGLRSAAADISAWQAAVLCGEADFAFHEYEVAAAASFSDDGKLVAVATHAGPRVYRWADLLAATGRFPAPVRAAASKLVTLGRPPGRMQRTQSVVFDGQNRLFYCGLEGRIGVLDDEVGVQAREFEVPGAPPLYRAVRTGNRRALAVVAQPEQFGRQRPPSELQIWSFDGVANAAVHRDEFFATGFGIGLSQG